MHNLRVSCCHIREGFENVRDFESRRQLLRLLSVRVADSHDLDEGQIAQRDQVAGGNVTGSYETNTNGLLHYVKGSRTFATRSDRTVGIGFQTQPQRRQSS